MLRTGLVYPQLGRRLFAEDLLDRTQGLLRDAVITLDGFHHVAAGLGELA